MFERFTDRARRVVVLAQEESRVLDHNFIGTEHVLLGLLAEGEGLAAQALHSQKIDHLKVQAAVREHVGKSKTPPMGHIPFTPRAKKVLELALREALALGHNYLGTEHILLGLIREGQGLAAQVLVELGADLSQIRKAVLDLLTGGASDEAVPGDLSSGLGVAYSQTLLRTGVGFSSAGYPGWTRLASAGMGGVTAVAAELGHDRIGTEHILLWLLRMSKGGAAQALQAHQVDVEGLRTRLEQQLDEAGGSTDP